MRPILPCPLPRHDEAAVRLTSAWCCMRDCFCCCSISMNLKVTEKDEVEDWSGMIAAARRSSAASEKCSMAESAAVAVIQQQLKPTEQEQAAAQQILGLSS